MKTYQFIQKDWKIENKIEDPCIQRVSSLLLPEEGRRLLAYRSSQFGTTEKYLEYLVKKARLIWISGSIPIGEKIKTEYQEKNQMLIKRSIKISQKLWEELKLMALSLGISVCKLVAWLMRVVDLVQLVGVPTVPIHKITLSIQLIPKKSTKLKILTIPKIPNLYPY